MEINSSGGSIDPKYMWLFLIFMGGSIFFILTIVLTPIALIIMSFYYRPLLFLFAFFLSLALVHLYLAGLIYKTPLKTLGVFLLYTLVVDLAICFLQGRLSLSLLYAPIMVLFLMLVNIFLQYLMNYHIRRNLFSKFNRNGFKFELNEFSIELKLRSMYNLIILFAFYFAGISGFIYRWNTSFLMARFAEYSFLCIVSLSVLKIFFSSKKLATMLSEDILSSTMEIPGYDDTRYHILNAAINERMSRENIRGKDEIVDYFDRAAEIRKLTYYSSLSLLLVSGAYLGLNTLLPLPLLSIPLGDVALGTCVLGLLAIQMPYYIGQKRLALNLAADFSGIQHREIMQLLGKESPAWRFINTGEILGAGLVPTGLIWLLKLLGKIG